ncbi:UNVERIFIED_CONTAM: hypothetical protein K2H54_035200 [Gekko kuhli]
MPSGQTKRTTANPPTGSAAVLQTQESTRPAQQLTDQLCAWISFQKAYHLVESPDLGPLPENSQLLKLRDSWCLSGDAKVQEKLAQVCSRAPGEDLPTGKSMRKRPCKTSLTRKKEGADRQRLIRKPCCDGQVPSTAGSDEQTCKVERAVMGQLA